MGTCHASPTPATTQRQPSQFETEQSLGARDTPPHPHTENPPPDPSTRKQPTIKILHWNCRGLQGKEHEVLSLLSRDFTSESERAALRARTAVFQDSSAAKDADVCILSETHESGAALRLRDAFPSVLGLHLVGSSRTHTRGGGVAILFRKDRFKFHSSAENEVEVITLTSY